MKIPGIGYRWLHQGEILKVTDEYEDGYGGWINVSVSEGKECRLDNAFRRALATPEGFRILGVSEAVQAGDQFWQKGQGKGWGGVSASIGERAGATPQRTYIRPVPVFPQFPDPSSPPAPAKDPFPSPRLTKRFLEYAIYPGQESVEVPRFCEVVNAFYVSAGPMARGIVVIALHEVGTVMGEPRLVKIVGTEDFTSGVYVCSVDIGGEFVHVLDEAPYKLPSVTSYPKDNT